MRWYQLAENPLAISELYTTVPLLEGRRLKEVFINRDGPDVTFQIELLNFPDRAPTRWKLQGYKTVQLQLRFWSIPPIHIMGWPKENVVDIALEQTEQGKIAVQAISSQCKIQFLAEHFFIKLHKK